MKRKTEPMQKSIGAVSRMDDLVMRLDERERDHVEGKGDQDGRDAERLVLAEGDAGQEHVVRPHHVAERDDDGPVQMRMMFFSASGRPEKTGKISAIRPKAGRSTT